MKNFNLKALTKAYEMLKRIALAGFEPKINIVRFSEFNTIEIFLHYLSYILKEVAMTRLCL